MDTKIPEPTFTEAENMTYATVIRLATSNQGLFREGVCIFCKTTDVKHSEITTWVYGISGNTAVCNHCNVDAIVPKTVFNNMTDVERTYIINRWHNLGFGGSEK